MRCDFLKIYCNMKVHVLCGPCVKLYTAHQKLEIADAISAADGYKYNLKWTVYLLLTVARDINQS